jgi:SAM-dependent methyltransferase
VPRWRNTSGKTLSSPEWLEAHHRAKLPERIDFAKRLAVHGPKTVIDLGCGTGLWLDLLDKVLPTDCRLIGVDSDADSLDSARQLARGWNRDADFMLCDIAAAYQEIPAADLMLAFNVIPYLPNFSELLSYWHRQRTTERLVIRQYDGATIRFGPLCPEDRFAIDSSLHASLETSSEFDHYALDRTYEVIHRSDFSVESLSFDVIQRRAPFPAEFEAYFDGTVAWTREHLSDDARGRLDRALSSRGCVGVPLYFVQLDLVAVLSGAIDPGDPGRDLRGATVARTAP